MTLKHVPVPSFDGMDGHCGKVVLRSTKVRALRKGKNVPTKDAPSTCDRAPYVSSDLKSCLDAAFANEGRTLKMLKTFSTWSKLTAEKLTKDMNAHDRLAGEKFCHHVLLGMWPRKWEGQVKVDDSVLEQGVIHQTDKLVESVEDVSLDKRMELGEFVKQEIVYERIFNLCIEQNDL